MKKSCFLVALIATMFSFTGVKADTYTDGLAKVINNAMPSTLNIGQIEQQMVQSGMTNPDYVKGKFMDDLIEIMVPYYRNNMSEAEMNQMVEFFTRPEISAYATKVATTVANTQSDLNKSMQSSMMTIMQGGKPENLKPAACDETYLKSFNRFMEVNKAEENINEVMGGLKAALGNMPQGDASQKAQMEKMVNGVLDFVKDNIKTIILNACVGKITAEELDTYNTLGDQPFYKAYCDTNKDITANIMPITQQIMAKLTANK